MKGADILGVLSGEWHQGDPVLIQGTPDPLAHSPRLAGLDLALPLAQAPPGLMHSILSLWSEYFMFQ